MCDQSCIKEAYERQVRLTWVLCIIASVGWLLNLLLVFRGWE